MSDDFENDDYFLQSLPDETEMKADMILAFAEVLKALMKIMCEEYDDYTRNLGDSEHIMKLTPLLYEWAAKYSYEHDSWQEAVRFAIQSCAQTCPPNTPLPTLRCSEMSICEYCNCALYNTEHLIRHLDRHLEKETDVSAKTWELFTMVRKALDMQLLNYKIEEVELFKAARTRPLDPKEYKRAKKKFEDPEFFMSMAVAIMGNKNYNRDLHVNTETFRKLAEGFLPGGYDRIHFEHLDRIFRGNNPTENNYQTVCVTCKITTGNPAQFMAHLRTYSHQMNLPDKEQVTHLTTMSAHLNPSCNHPHDAYGAQLNFTFAELLKSLLPILNGATGVGWWAERDYIAKLIPFMDAWAAKHPFDHETWKEAVRFAIKACVPTVPPSAPEVEHRSAQMVFCAPCLRTLYTTEHLIRHLCQHLSQSSKKANPSTKKMFKFVNDALEEQLRSWVRAEAVAAACNKPMSTEDAARQRKRIQDDHDYKVSLVLSTAMNSYFGPDLLGATKEDIIEKCPDERLDIRKAAEGFLSGNHDRIHLNHLDRIFRGNEQDNDNYQTSCYTCSLTTGDPKQYMIHFRSFAHLMKLKEKDAVYNLTTLAINLNPNYTHPKDGAGYSVDLKDVPSDVIAKMQTMGLFDGTFVL